MSLLDDLLRLFGTNRIRLRWRLQQLRDRAARQQRSLANRSQALTYEHQLCPSCGHPEAKGDKVCSRCGAKLHGATVNKASRALAWIIPEGVPVVTMVYLAACIALYLVTVKATYDFFGDEAGGSFKPAGLQLIRYGANFRELVQGGEWWRLVTANFLHGSITHIGMNAYGLWVAGTVIEERFGAARTAFVLVVTGIAGAWLSYAYSGHGFSVGASTAGFGQMGFVVGHALRYRGRATADLRERFIPWLIYGLIMSFAVTNIDIYGHIGGLVAGLVLGVVLADKQQARRLPSVVWNVLAIACVAAVAWAFFQMSQWQLTPEVKSWFNL